MEVYEGQQANYGLGIHPPALGIMLLIKLLPRKTDAHVQQLSLSQMRSNNNNRHEPRMLYIVLDGRVALQMRRQMKVGWVVE